MYGFCLDFPYDHILCSSCLGQNLTIYYLWYCSTVFLTYMYEDYDCMCKTTIVSTILFILHIF